MPLEHSATQPAFKRNVAALMHDVGKSPHVQSQKQALAIAFATQRRAAGNRAAGGVVPRFDIGGGVDPVAAVISALSAGATSGMAAPGSSNAMAPSSQPATAASNPTPMQAPPAAGVAPAPMNATASVGTNPAVTPLAPGVAPNPIQASLLARGGVPKRFAGGFNMGQGPNLNPSWEERNEARNLHVGPVLSNVPGRVDNHAVKVPAGSYVLPAAHVASMGQGNTMAGMSVASKMFGGPYGTSAPKIAHGSLPRPPKPMGAFANGGYSEGGARGTGHYEPVAVDISGGEYVIPPQAIIRKYGSLKRGHAILDNWVMHARKKEIATLKKLPPPAKK